MSQGSLTKEEHELLEEPTVEDGELREIEETKNAKVNGMRKDGTLIVDEEIGEGRVGWSAYESPKLQCLASSTLTLWYRTVKHYCSNTARIPSLYWSTYMATLCITHFLINTQVRQA